MLWRSFSAPVITMRSERNCSGRHLRVYAWRKVGVAKRMVSFSASTSSPMRVASMGLGWYTVGMPQLSGSQRVARNPNEWKNGSEPSMRSLFSMPRIRITALTLLVKLWWVRMAPLGMPVEPLEKRTVAGPCTDRAVAGK